MTETLDTGPRPEQTTGTGDETGRLDNVSKGRIIAILTAIVLFSEVAPLQFTMVSPAVQKIGMSFPSAGANISWVFIILGLVGGAITPLLGKLGDLAGKKLILFAAGVIFLLGSVVCALTETWWVFLAGRSLQAVSMGMTAVVPGLLRDLMPRKYVPMAIGAVGTGFGLSALAAPIISGALTDVWSWRSIFWFLAIYMIVMLPVFWLVVPETKLRVRERLDLVGSLLLGGAAALILVYLSNGHVWGWGRWDALAYPLIGAVLLLLFFAWEKRVAVPIMDMGLLRSPKVLVILGIGLFANMIIGVQSYIVPYIAQTDDDYVRSATIAGFAEKAGIPVEQMGQALTFHGDISYALGWSLMTVALGLILWQTVPSMPLGPLTGAWAKRVGLRLPLIIALALMTASMALYALLHGSWVQLAIIGVVFGLGFGMYYACAYNLVVDAVPQEQQGIGTGMLVLLSSFGSSVGVAILTSILSAHPYQVSMTVSPSAPPQTYDIPQVYTDTGWTLGFWAMVVAGLLALGLAVVMRSGRTPATGGELVQH